MLDITYITHPYTTSRFTKRLGELLLVEGGGRVSPRLLRVEGLFSARRPDRDVPLLHLVLLEKVCVSRNPFDFSRKDRERLGTSWGWCNQNYMHIDTSTTCVDSGTNILLIIVNPGCTPNAGVPDQALRPVRKLVEE